MKAPKEIHLALSHEEGRKNRPLTKKECTRVLLGLYPDIAQYLGLPPHQTESYIRIKH